METRQPLVRHGGPEENGATAGDLRHEQDGQTLIYVALFLTTLLAFLALAIDVGYVYSERRRMQNAADAGALAGAQQICLDHRDQAEAKALEYAITRNGAQSATADIQDGLVTVVASTTVHTFLASVVGVPTVDVSARAEAACANANKSCNFWPIAYSVYKWSDLADMGCGTEFVVIDSEKICGVDYDCDQNDDGVDDIIMGGGRGWLDLPWPDEVLFPTPCHRSCGESKMRCFIENPYPGWIVLPACILSEPGVMTTAFAAAAGQAGRTVRIPLFDDECPAEDALGDCGGTEAYHIVDFACVDVLSFVKKFQIWDYNSNDWETEKALRVAVSCDEDCYAFCGGTRGWEPGDGDNIAVSLTH